MATTTTNFSFTKPAVNSAVDQDQWGTQLNQNLDDLDSYLLTARDAVPVAATSTDTLDSTDRNKIVYCTSTGAYTVNLPSSTIGSGFGVTIYKADTSTNYNIITIDGSSNQTVGPSTTYTLNAPGDAVSLVASGSTAGWYLKGEKKAVITAPINYGCILSQTGGDPDHDISISAGQRIDPITGFILTNASALVKQTDATWAVGTNQGGMFTGSVTTSTWYHVFLIRNSTTGVIDAGYDTSATAANIPSGYVAYAYLGAVLTDGSSNITDFTQIGDMFIWTTKTLDFDETIDSASPETKTLRVPTGVNCLANVNLITDQFLFRVYYTGETNAAPAYNATPLGMTADITNYSGTNGFVMTDTSGQVKAQTSNGTASRCSVQFYRNLSVKVL